MKNCKNDAVVRRQFIKKLHWDHFLYHVTLELLQDTSSVTLSLHHLLESQSRRLWAQFGSQSTKDGGSGLEMYVLLLDSGISILNVLRLIEFRYQRQLVFVLVMTLEPPAIAVDP